MRALLLCLLAALVLAAPARAAFPGVDGDVLFDFGTLHRVGADGTGLGPAAAQPAADERLVPAPGGPMAVREDGDGLVVRRLGVAGTQRIEGVSSDYGLAIGPDGDRYASVGTESSVRVGTISGTAPPTQIAFTGEPTLPGFDNVRWTPDGSELIGTYMDTTQEIGHGYSRVGAVDPDTGVARLIQRMPNQQLTHSGSPRVNESDSLLGQAVDVSPDGTTVVYVRQHERLNGCPSPFLVELCEVYVRKEVVSVPIEGGEETILLATDEVQRHLAPTPAFENYPASGQLLQAAYADASVAYAPSGDKLVVLWSQTTSEGNATSHEVRTLDPLTGAPDVLATFTPVEGTRPALVGWAPPPAPIVFVHGFLGSRLRCGSDVQWPGTTLGGLSLAADGTSEAGCGATLDGVVDTVFGKDIYGSTLDFLGLAAPGSVYPLAWDWRKSPQQSLAALDALIDQAQADHPGQKVAILAHSMGGLLTRWYLDDADRADKVARALIVGTPSWGAPKSLFPLATGQETPGSFSGLDVALDDDDLKGFARNLAGAYFLYPSAKYGTWLTVEGRTPSVLDTAEKLQDYVGTDLSGNAALLADALQRHADVLDGWKTNGVDVRAVVGSGLNTVVGVDLRPDTDAAELRFGNGDETVPARSATQGPPGTSDPLGEDIPIHYACGVSHVPLAGNAALTAMGAAGFLVYGQALTALTQPCDNGGFSVEVASVTIGRGASRAVAMDDIAGADVIRFPGRTYVVTDDATPVTVPIPDGTTATVRRLDGETAGPAQTVSGPATVATGGGEVTLTPDATPTPSPTPSPSPEASPTPTAAGTAPTAAPTASPTAAPTAAPSATPDRTPPTLKITVRKRGRRFVVTVTATDPSGVQSIQFKLGKRFTRYTKALRLTKKQLRKVRVRATDRAGNVSRAKRVRRNA